jgi:hypothetical protein
VFVLAAPTFILLGKGEEWQIGHIANVRALHASLSEPGLIESRTLPDIVKLSSQVLILQLTQHGWLHRFHIFIPVKSFHPIDSFMLKCNFSLP